MSMYVLRSIIAVGAAGVCLWAVISSFIVWRNYKTTGNKRTLAVLYLMVVISIDYAWQFVRQYDQLRWPHDTSFDSLLYFKIAVFVFYWLAITNFMLRLFGMSVRRLVKRWLFDD